VKNLRLVARHLSAHFGGTTEADVLADHRAAAYPKTGPRQDYAVGAVLAERFAEVNGSLPAVLLVMLKREPTFNPAGCDWEYVTLRGDRTVLENGDGSLCARCHAEAPHQCVFGLGR
jgi:hypothetical protein